MDVDKIIATMNLGDKIALCEGANFWETRSFPQYGIPAMFVCDGPNGLRKQDLSGGTDMLGINKSRRHNHTGIIIFFVVIKRIGRYTDNR